MANSRVFLLALACLTLAACGDAVSPSSEDAQFGIRRFGDPNPDSLRGPSTESSYIVVFRPGVADPAGLTDQLVRTYGGRVAHRYQHALQGFAGVLPDQAIDGIRRNPNVELVEPDGIATTAGSQVQPPSWGLDRIDARPLPLDGVYNSQNDGAGVRVYILDTGVMLDHIEYFGRAGSGWDFVENDANASDCHGHGTHVAGTVAGATVGVAKAATIISVRVLGCTGSGPWSQVIAGLDWLIANHVKPAVANMSLSGSATQSVNTAVSNAVAAGVTIVVAAGNAAQNACSYSPGSTADALTVGATTRTDSRAAFSNYGSCVDLFAPGTEILSSVKTGSYESWNGTSMAAPHVAGVAALYLAANPTAAPAQVSEAILGGATLDLVIDAGPETPNRLLYNQIAGDAVLPPLPPPPPPTVDPTTEIRVADLDGSAAAGRGSWTAIVRTLVQDLTGAPAPNVTVYGEWSEGAKGTASCITGDDGWCSIVKEGIKKGSSSARLTVYNLKAPGKVYTEVQNGDPDADSDGTYIVVRRP